MKALALQIEFHGFAETGISAHCGSNGFEQLLEARRRISSFADDV